MHNAYELNIHDWMSLLSKWQASQHHAETLFKSSFQTVDIQKNISSPISPKVMTKISETISYALPKIISSATARDGTTCKYLLQLEDGEIIESVLLKFFKRYTVCLSTQVGCGMGCKFCYTGTLGLKRHLKAYEIIGQYVCLAKQLQIDIPHALAPQVVFMGEGEPLHNFECIQKSLEILTHPKSFNLGPQNITLSTVGLIEYLEKLNLLPKINLAFSLHAPNQKLREVIIPSAKKNPLPQIMLNLDNLYSLGRKFITFEYTLIDQINDQDCHIDKLIELLKPRKHYALLNLIPLNPFKGLAWKKTPPERIEIIRKKLIANNIRTFQRKTQGSDILAACGQLKPTSYAAGEVGNQRIQ